MTRAMHPKLLRRLLIGVVGVVSAAILTLLGGAVLVDAGHFNDALVRYIAHRTGRQIRVAGTLHTHLLSLTPELTATQVAIGNPPWMPPGLTAEFDTLTLTFDLPGSVHSSGIHRLEMRGAALHLVRDAKGHSNWQSNPPGTHGTGPPLIRSLSMPGARVELNDARRHLRFTGTVSALDVDGAARPPPLRIEGGGELNGRNVSFVINGDALESAAHTQPYHFDFDERSSGSHLTGHGSMPRPLDFSYLAGAFEASGEDMKDLFFLAGVSLPNTGPYRLSGNFVRERSHIEYTDLEATSGRSDVRGTLSIQSSKGQSRIELDLHSQLLRLADLGARAAGRQTDAEKAWPLLLPDTAMPVDGLRHAAGRVKFHADAVQIGRLSLEKLAAQMTMDDGVLELAPLSASFHDGSISGRIKIDAKPELPRVHVDLSLAKLALEKFHRNGSQPPAIEGELRARMTLNGEGTSIHRLAAGSDGTVIAVLPHGMVRDSWAELAGFDLRALGLMLRAGKNEAAIRCGVASFEDHHGTLTAQTMMMDTDPVLINGTGTIRFDSETLDLTLQGRPKHLRLMRVRAPLVIRGTLSRPLIGVKPGKAAVQTGVAVALGVALTPLASILAFVDPGSAKDADCAAVINEVQTAPRR